MRTSYFAKSANNPNAVSIAGKAPAGFAGRVYKKLAPKFWFYQKYKEDGDEFFYTEQYRKEVLNLLDPMEVYNELGEESILLCWEGKDKFCHRKLVARWLEVSLGIQVPEL
jgi:hypothetical protein